MVTLPRAPVMDQQDKTKEMDNTLNTKAARTSLFQIVCFIAWSPLHFLFKICKSEIAVFLITIPWKVIVYIFKLRGKNALNDIMSMAGNVVEEAESIAFHGKDESPLAEEIAIPSVTELSKIGVKFIPTKGGLSTVQFDKLGGVFHLPVIHLNDNSDVVLRNLVAYEACMGPRP
ncbi:putative UPF0481 protein [Spatholobus suberectus]|nr:putative UPF0481 protein [Spatholobus suberectus]